MTHLRTLWLVLVITNYTSYAQHKESGFINSSKLELKLDPWQTEIASKENKNILDYYLLLPKTMLDAEIETTNDSKKNRMQSAKDGNINLKAGYLVAMPNVSLTMVLYKDRVNKKDVIGIVFGCGEPPIQYCDYGFIEFNQKEKKWKENTEVFPWTEFESKCLRLENEYLNTSEDGFAANIILPEYGTTIQVINAYDSTETPVFKVIWNGTKFELKK